MRKKAATSDSVHPRRSRASLNSDPERGAFKPAADIVSPRGQAGPVLVSNVTTCRGTLTPPFLSWSRTPAHHARAGVREDGLNAIAAFNPGSSQLPTTRLNMTRFSRDFFVSSPQ